MKGDRDADDERAVLEKWLELSDAEADLKKKLKEADAALDAKALAKYPKLTQDEVKTLVVDDKWLTKIAADTHGEMARISQALSERVRTLAERYETRMPDLAERVASLETKVNEHLKEMGFAW
jgi:type I restriction enzyme M protein